MTEGVVRIIGGRWRGRKLKVLPLKELRPTPDRVRETLFNWLAPFIAGANCLDVFAGSGVLSFEALSRGARKVVMVDESSAIVECLQQAATTLQASDAEIYRARAPEGLHVPKEPFDIVFLDPPYLQNILLPVCDYLEKQGFLAANALIYLEAKKSIDNNDLPDTWQIIKSKKAGQVFYHLAKRNIEVT